LVLENQLSVVAYVVFVFTESGRKKYKLSALFRLGETRYLRHRLLYRASGGVNAAFKRLVIINASSVVFCILWLCVNRSLSIGSLSIVCFILFLGSFHSFASD